VKPQAYAPSIVRPISHPSAHRAKCGGEQLDHEDLDHELSSSIGGGRPGLCRRRKTINAWYNFCVPMAVVQHDQEGPMPQAAGTRSEEPLPLGTAILSNIALSLLMWNIALRLGWLLAAA
jgi:hypothetical protein